MKIIIPGGSGQVGRLLARAFARSGDACVVLSRRPGRTPLVAGTREVAWDGRTIGEWSREFDGADAVINLAGRTVDCRYSENHLAEMMRSRVDSTRVVGAALARANNPPRVWLQASTATVYAHRYDAPNDEKTGIIGGTEPGVPPLWKRSVDIALAWEDALAAADTPRTRKVALRSAMTMTPDGGGIFAALAQLARAGVGRVGDGRQFVSWIHGDDFVAAVRFLVAREDMAGPVNLCAPEPLPFAEFMAGLRAPLGSRRAFPIPRWALEVGAFFRRTESELLLKSRRVVPGRLRELGFEFRHPSWPAAAEDLVRRWRARG